MPANLTPQYHKAESAYRAAQSPAEELECLQTMLREIPKHKGTDKLQAELKAKISKAKEASQQPKKTTGPITKINRQGAGRVLLIGPPNCGKSQILTSMTNATPEVADYPFTTQTPTPGMMHHEDVPFQLIDLPPITPDYFDTEILNLVRGADLIFFVIDLASDSLIEDTEAIMNRFNSGKTQFGRATELDPNDIGVARTETILILNKSDADGADEREKMLDEFVPLDFDRFRISATNATGLDEVASEVFDRLDIVRVYTKNPKEKTPDLTKPFCIRQGDTIVEVAAQLHKDMAEKVQSARVWGKNVHDGTVVKRDYEPSDKDVIELH